MHFTKLLIELGLFVLVVPLVNDTTVDLQQSNNVQEESFYQIQERFFRVTDRILADMSLREARIKIDLLGFENNERLAKLELDVMTRQQAVAQQKADDLTRQDLELREQIKRDPSVMKIVGFEKYVRDVGKRREEAVASNEVLRKRKDKAMSAYNDVRQAYVNVATTSKAQLARIEKQQKVIEHYLQSFRAGEDSKKLLQQVLWIAAEEDIKSNVHLKVNGGPQPKVKYQLELSSDIQTAKCEPECDESMPIGVYYIWSERNGKTTSPKDKYTIVNESEAVTINEYP